MNADRRRDAACGARARRRLLAIGCALASLGAGCASTTYDPLPPSDEPQRITRIRSPLDVERSFRRLYSRLDECLDGYHVQPRYDRRSGEARIMIVSGLGLDRLSVLGNRFAARFEIRPDRSPGAAGGGESAGGSRIEVVQVDRDLTPTVAASIGWLTLDSRECRA